MSKNKKISDIDEAKREQKLQAVLLADSFSKSFRPMTLQSPKVLLPLVNVPMIEYTVEFLARNGVGELFIFCVWHAKTLQEYIHKTKWPSSIIVHCITSSGCSSAGDAVRELDSMGVIRSDPFVLISGDVISNINLEKVIQFHTKKKKEDSNALMTVVFKKVQPTTGIKQVMDDLIVGIDTENSQIILFEDNLKSSSVSLPVELLAEHPNVDFCTDILDCQIDICSPELMLQFSDNFDYQDIRQDFIRNEVLKVDLGAHIYGYLLEDEYAARIQDPHTYHSISRDIVSRWAYPFVCDAFIISDANYTHLQRCTYKEDSVKIPRSATLGEGVVLGRGCSIGNRVTIDRSIIGRNCIISLNSKIIDSHILENVTIEEGVTITKSIVGPNVTIKKNSTLSRGCMLSNGTVVGSNMTLTPFTRITLKHHLNPIQKGVKGLPETDEEILGKDGKGVVWVYEGSGDYEDVDADYSQGRVIGGIGNSEHNRAEHNRLRAESVGCDEDISLKMRRWIVMPDPTDDSEDLSYIQDSVAGDFGNDVSFDQSQSNLSSHTFIKNVTDMVLTGYQEGHPPENVVMEIKGYKFSQNKTFSDCIRGAVPGLVAIVDSSSSSKDNFLKFLLKFLREKGWGNIILKSLLQNKSDEVLTLICLETEAMEPTRIATLHAWLHLLLKLLYDSDVISQSAFLSWIAEKEQDIDSTNNQSKKLLQETSMRELISYIQQEEDEDEDDEEGDEEE